MDGTTTGAECPVTLRAYLAACIDQRLRDAVAAFLVPEGPAWSEPPPVEWAPKPRHNAMRRHYRNSRNAARRIRAKASRGEPRGIDRRDVGDEEWTAWEERLRAEGLGALDDVLPDGTVRVHKRGSGTLYGDGKVDPATKLHRRQVRADYIDWARGVLHTYAFATPLERRVWALHCDGVGLLTIASHTPGLSFRMARTIVKRVTRLAGGAPVKQDEPVQVAELIDGMAPDVVQELQQYLRAGGDLVRARELRALVQRSDVDVLHALRRLLDDGATVQRACDVPMLRELLRGSE